MAHPGENSDLGRVLPLRALEEGLEWFCGLTRAPAALFSCDRDEPRGPGGGAVVIHGTHPALKVLAESAQGMESVFRDCLWQAAMLAVERRCTVSGDSPLGDGTILARPFYVTADATRVCAGAVAAFVHPTSALRNAEGLARACHVPRHVALAAVQAALEVGLTPPQAAAAAAALETFLDTVVGPSGGPDVGTGQAGDAGAAPADDTGLDMSAGTLPAGEAGMGPPRDILADLGARLAGITGAGVVQVWARDLGGQLCDACGHQARCGTGGSCLHSVVLTGGSANGQFDHIPLDALPGQLLAQGALSVVRGTRHGDGEVLYRWVEHHGLRAAEVWCICREREVRGLVALARPRRVPQMDGLLHEIRAHVEYGLAWADSMQREREHVQRLQELSLRLAVNNERLRKSHQNRSVLLSTMGQNLRAPLNAVLGLADILRNGGAGDVTDRQAAHLTTIISSARHVTRLLDDLLSIYALETGDVALRQEACVAAQVLADAVQSTLPVAQSRQVHIEADLPPDSAVIITDANRLRQLAVNLLAGAVRSSPPAGTVHMYGAVVGRELIVRLRDQAPTRAAEDLDTLFDRYETGVSPADADSGSTGLGLPLAMRIVDVLGGSVEITNPAAGGNETLLRLPTGPLPTAQQPSERTAAATPSGQSTGPLAVILEEDTPSRLILAQVAGHAGFQVVELSSAAHLQPTVRARRPNLVVIGQARRSEAPFSAIELLRAQSETSELPVVFIGEAALLERALAIGVTSVLSYPVAADELSQLLRRVGMPRPEAAPKLALVLDDNPIFADAMSVIVETAGLQVLRAQDGPEGISLAVRYRPDVVLLDFMLPGANGLQVIERLRANERTRDIPVIMLTVKPLTPTERVRLESQADAVLSKAVSSPETIWNLLRKLGVGTPALAE